MLGAVSTIVDGVRVEGDSGVVLDVARTEADGLGGRFMGMTDAGVRDAGILGTLLLVATRSSVAVL